MLTTGPHSMSWILSCDDGVYRGTRLRNKAKGSQDMRTVGNMKAEKQAHRKLKILY